MNRSPLRARAAVGAAALLLLAIGAAACDDTLIDPFDNDGRIYTVYGFLEEDFEDLRHVVRVIPVTRIPEVITDPADPRGDLDAVVTSTDLATGETHRWTPALERLDDGTYAHLYRSAFFVRRGHTYRLEVTRSDGRRAWAETTVPSPSGIEPVFGAPVVGPGGAITQEVTLPRVASPWDVTVIYHVGGDFSTTPMPVAYGREGTPTDDGGWRFTIHVSRDRGRLSARLGTPVDQVRFPAMGLKIRLLDDQWTPPEGVFDPEVLAQPGALSNVENGYGFWGSIGLFQHDWQLAPELRTLLGF
ncbi:MAG: hypothetical protein R3247_07540 [Rhodothermales bacterium]|nr:hypothetical protein [Rhodothermales bacterium]